MPLYAKFIKDMINKSDWKEVEIVVFTKECSSIIQRNLPKKLQDLGSFVIPYRSINFPFGVVEDLLVKVGSFIFPTDFVILDMEEEKNASIILGRPFLATARALIDVQKEVFEARILEDDLDASPEDTLLGIDEPAPQREKLRMLSIEEGPPMLELKLLPPSLKYAFLGDKDTYPVIISSSPSPTKCMHKILLEDDAKQVVQPQRQLNPTMKEVVQKEVMKLWEAEIIYPISGSLWVTPVQVVPKRGGMTVIQNKRNELIPTRLVTRWRMCIDYRRLNNATRKDHFPLPFIDQMLKRLAGHAFYCFLDGYSGYNQIAVDPQDQEKRTFTCPFGVFAYRRMPFGLWAVLGQRQDKLLHIIYYASHVLNDAQKNYTTIEKELLAVIYAIDKFRSYLIGSKEFNIEIRDRKGSENQVADHLSRIEPKEGTLPPTATTETFLDRRCVSDDEAQQMLWHCHSSEYGGHFGGDRKPPRSFKVGSNGRPSTETQGSL
ncbi:uncharacterized protein LOC130977086 [Arachis stenosperma]|uniref:uncharacterized protein LOC130977086 n=1 Tax=Arachis stenosperma TaxID=217475 RepID=UPI0025ABA3B9|nr:uncharacterized protein LOC130977086 [Arachis stenosperma]